MDILNAIQRFVVGWRFPVVIISIVFLVVVSLLVPATSTGPASMQFVPRDYTIDWYYLLPLFFTDRHIAFVCAESAGADLRIDAERVRYVRYDRSDTKALLAAAAAFRDGSSASALRRTRPAAVRYAVVASLLVGLGGLTLALSDATYWSPPMRRSELVVSFKHAGQVVEAPESAAANQDDLLPHMRGAPATRQIRTPVRLRVFVDGRRVVDRAYGPGGLFNDGSSIAIEPIPVPAGTHHVRVQLGDAVDHNVWTYEDERDLGFKVAERRVILFDAVSGFTWY